jgi:hypothetical protein
MKKYTSLIIALLTLTLFVGNRASAAIVYSGIQNVAYSEFNDPGAFSLFNAPGNWDDIRLDLFLLDLPLEKSYRFGSMVNVHGNYVEFAVGSDFRDIKNFSTGNLIGGASVWSGNNYGDFSSFDENFQPDPPFTDERGEFRNTTGYAGMRLTDGADVYFGWIQVSVSNYNNSGITGTLIDWAYESTPNAAILAGAGPGPAAVPEPGTWAAAALLVGGAGYVRWRKRAKVA